MDSNFAEALASQETVVVDFYAKNCAPCRRLSAVIDQTLSNDKVMKIDVDEDQEDLVTRFDIRSVPTLILFKNGKEIRREMKALNKSELIEFLG
jgi:thioredoxin 1